MTRGGGGLASRTWPADDVTGAVCQLQCKYVDPQLWPGIWHVYCTQEANYRC
jgi:hypothetical protein